MFEEILTSMIPFLFVLVIIYGALEVGGIFNKRINTLIAVIISFFVMSSESYVEFIHSILPFAAGFFIVFFFLGFVISFFKKTGGEKNWELIGIIALLLLVILTTQSENIEAIFPLTDILNNLLVLIGIVFIGLIFYAAYKQKT